MTQIEAIHDCWIQDGKIVGVLGTLAYLAEANSQNESEPSSTHLLGLDRNVIKGMKRPAR